MPRPSSAHEMHRGVLWHDVSTNSRVKRPAYDSGAHPQDQGMPPIRHFPLSNFNGHYSKISSTLLNL